MAQEIDKALNDLVNGAHVGDTINELVERAMLKGAGIGAALGGAIGAGYGAKKHSKDDPDRKKKIVKNVVKGALVGAGLGAAAGHEYKSRKKHADIGSVSKEAKDIGDEITDKSQKMQVADLKNRIKVADIAKRGSTRRDLRSKLDDIKAMGQDIKSRLGITKKHIGKFKDKVNRRISRIDNTGKG